MYKSRWVMTCLFPFPFFLIEKVFWLILLWFAGLNDDKQAIEDFRLVWDFCLDQGICVGAYKLGENGELLNLIGTNFLFVSTEDSEKIIIDLMVSKKFYKKPFFQKEKNMKKVELIQVFERNSFLCTRKIRNLTKNLKSVKFMLLFL